MNTNTKIEWTDVTWSPVVGCSRVSPGCTNCYAAAMDKRIRGIAGQKWRDWTTPNAAYNVRLHPERLTAPLRWRKPRRVFVNSMSDLFHERVPDEFIDRVFAVMALCPQHQFQVLTKRPERMREYLTATRVKALAHERWPTKDFIYWEAIDHIDRRRAQSLWNDHGFPWPLSNVWLGVSAEDQRRADERIPLLLETPAAVRFLSCEPLLGPIDIAPQWLGMNENDGPDYVRWVIVGGESGPGARPCDVAWIRGIVAQCQAADVPVFVKQLGARPENECIWDGPVRSTIKLQDRKGGNMDEWPADLRIRQFPGEVTL